MEKNEEKNNEEKNNEEFENIEKENIKKQEEDNINENFFSAAFENIGRKFGSKLDSVAKVGRNLKKTLKSTFSKENMRSVGNKIKYAASKEGLRDAGKKISNAGSSIKTKALGLRVSSNMNSFYMLKLKEVLENYDGSNSKDDFVKKITKDMQNYKEFVAEKVKSWLNNEDREKALGDKIKAGYNELNKKYSDLNYDWLKKKIPSFSKKIRIEILKKSDCIGALKNHLENYGKIDPLWDILTRGSKITRSGALKSKTIGLLLAMTDSLSGYEGNDPMDVGIYANSLMSYLLKNFKGKGEKKDSDWKLKCGLLLVRYSQQEGSYFDSLGKMVDERVNKIYKSISITKQLSKLQKSCKTIPEMLDKASGSKKGTASIAIGVGISYSNPVAIEVLKKVYTAKGLPSPDTASIQNNSGSIYDLITEIKDIISDSAITQSDSAITQSDSAITQYDTDSEYQKWFDSLVEIADISSSNKILEKIKSRQHLKDFESEEAFQEYMKKEYKKKINDEYGKTFEEYKDLLEELKKGLEKYSGEQFNNGGNPDLFEMAKKNLENFKYMLSDDFIEDEIKKELENYNPKEVKYKENETQSDSHSEQETNKETIENGPNPNKDENINESSSKEENKNENEEKAEEKLEENSSPN